MTVSERGDWLYSETGRHTDISHHLVFSAREQLRQEETPVGLTRWARDRTTARTIFRTLQSNGTAYRAHRKQSRKQHPNQLFTKRTALGSQVHRPVDDRHEKESREEDSSFKLKLR